jgi:Flp pilus assembly protein protease CpaA
MGTRPARPSRRRDELDGFRPALLLAAGLGVITSSIVAAMLTIWLLSISAAGGFGSGVAGLIAAAVVWIGFWIGLSLGLAVGLMAGFRVWLALYPAAQRNAAAHRIRVERRAAVAEAEAVLREAELSRDPKQRFD